MQKQKEKEDFQDLMLLSEVQRLRIELPSVGVDVLHHQLAEFRHCHGIKVGRDKLANLLRDNNLLIRKRKRQVKTTYSNHRFYKYPNLTVGKIVIAPNCLWVSDITARAAPICSTITWLCLFKFDNGRLFSQNSRLGC